MSTDADLVLAARRGDRSAFAGIYDRYADRIHDFCHSMLRDREEAADAMQDTFVAAAERLSQLREVDRLKAWLYAIARNECLRRFRARNRLSYGDDLTDLPGQEPGPEEEATHEELRELVWSAAAGLNERDQALMDLHVRQGLDGQDLAEAMGVSASHSYVLLTRLRDQVERSLGALLVARSGRDDCPDLAAVLGDWDGRFSPLLRKRVARHVDDCDLCADRRRRMASPMALMGSVPLLAAPPELRDRVLGAIDLKSSSTSLPPGAGRSRRVVAAVGAAALIALLLVGVPMIVSAGGDSAGPQAGPTGSAGAPTPSPTPGATRPSAGPTVVPSVLPTPASTPVTAGRLTVSTSALLFGPTVTSQSLTLSNSGGSPLAWSATPFGDWIRITPSSGTLAGGSSASVLISADRSVQPQGIQTTVVQFTTAAGSVQVKVTVVVDPPPTVSNVQADQKVLVTTTANCGTTTTLVGADVTDQQGLKSVTLRWTLDPDSGAIPMAEDGSYHTGVLGGFKQAGTLTYWVVATDSAGQSTESKHLTMPVLDKC